LPQPNANVKPAAAAKRDSSVNESPSTTADEARGWVIGIGHPLRPERRLAEVLLEDRAAGTSGAGFQFFRHAGKRYGHILDPRTGAPPSGVPVGAGAGAAIASVVIAG